MKRRPCSPCENGRIRLAAALQFSPTLAPQPNPTCIQKQGAAALEVAQKEFDGARKSKESSNNVSFEGTGRHVCFGRRRKKDSDVDVFPLHA